MIKINPCMDYVLVKRQAPATEKAGIVIPESAQATTQFTVIKSGPGSYQNGILIPTGLKPGQTAFIAEAVLNSFDEMEEDTFLVRGGYIIATAEEVGH